MHKVIQEWSFERIPGPGGGGGRREGGGEEGREREYAYLLLIVSEEACLELSHGLPTETYG